MVDITNTLGGVSKTSQTAGTTSTPKKELDQASFLKLLTMQLSYQDPFKPVDNAQTLSQMTSMSTSDAINRLSSQMGGLNDLMTSSQALQASSLVGQSVLIPSDTGYLDKDGQISGVVAVGGQKLSNLKITVEDDKGQVIKDFVINGEQQGNVPFTWDGTDKDGKPVAAGKYKIKASGTDASGKSESIPALTYGQVESVTLGSAASPTRVQLQGLGSILLTDILEISGTKSKPTPPTEPTTPTSSAVI
ncbi:flagellar hook assembly protein FlgD [Aeromonas enteropelogenes]|uniref:flagellar hook assembly protein FlgD n=1 Tax=Aeromonas enteropelogenes TaxID=29489 RepID=UPI001CCF2A05|nr:flagellar hook assembly protein FlgD [Aeromonas enteropelogenes]UBH29405.1 flagellar hook assembly protein FlgD [Aeromonas enteropelogenes]